MSKGRDSRAGRQAAAADADARSATTGTGESTLRQPRRATLLDKLAIGFGVVLPTFAKGPVVRRPRMLRLLEWLDADKRAVGILQRLRGKHGDGALKFTIAGRQQAVILSAEDVREILLETPEPFSPASFEKTAALAHFEPGASLLSSGRERQVRRQINDAALEPRNRCHTLALAFERIVQEEAAALLSAGRPIARWDDFNRHWQRTVRRVTLGERAGADEALTALLDRLRRRANWAFFLPRDEDLRARLRERLGGYLARAEPDSLAERIMAAIPEGTAEDAQPADQVAHWLFAFDAAGMSTWRALALLASHPDKLENAVAETQRAGPSLDRPFLRAAVLEALRLWPTTPALLRETVSGARLGRGSLPRGCGILIFAPLLHRDRERLGDIADRFSPELWPDGVPDERWPFVAFSQGPGICPGRHLVLLLTSGFLGALIAGGVRQLEPPDRLRAGRPLPGTLSPFDLSFRCIDRG